MSRRGITERLPSPASNDGRYSTLQKFLTIDFKTRKIDINEAHYFFDQMLYMRPPPPISWFRKLFSALVKSQLFSVPISFYKRLHVSGVLGLRTDLIIMNVLLNCYSSMKLGRVGYSAFGVILKNGYHPDVFSFNSLVKGLCLEEKLVEAVGLISKMSKLGCPADTVTYNTILNSLCTTGNVATALQLHREMVHGKESRRPTTVSYTLIDGCCIEWPMVEAKQKNARISPDVFSYSCLIDGLFRSGMDEDAKSLLAEMIDRGVYPNTVTYNIMIDLLCKHGKLEEATEILQTMILRGKFPDTVTFNTIVDGYCRIGKLETAMNLYKDMNSMGISADRVTINTLLKGLFLARKVGDAMILFRSMKKMDVNGACRTYAIMIDGLCKEGHVDKAEELFLELQESISPSVYAYACLINGLCKQGHIGKAEKLFFKMLASDVSPNVVIYSTLIDGLCEEGDTHKAKELFLQMQSSGISPGVVSYNILIDGFYRSGNVEEANKLLEKMIRDGILPSPLTFKIIISNLGKGGSTALAAHNVISLIKGCGYECDVASYNELICGYCKAGLLEGAYNLLVEMEAKGCSPNVMTYNTLVRGFAHEKESARVKELLQKMHNIRISSNSNATTALLECINRNGETQ